MQSANAYNTYKNNSVNHASREQLLLMLVDGAVKFSKRALNSIESKNIQDANENLIKTQNIFNELIVSLDITAGEWAVNIRDIYAFIVSELIEINITKSSEKLAKVIEVIEEVKGVWNEAYKLSKQGV